MASLGDPYETPTKLGLLPLYPYVNNPTTNLEIVSKAVLSICWLEQVKP